jgi:dihydrofolate reductase
MVSLVRSHSPDEGTPLELVVGMTMFASVSLGTSALVLGRHLFDQVEISERWARRTIDPSVVDLKFASLNVMARSEFQILKPHENQIVASDPVESEVRSVLSP